MNLQTKIENAITKDKLLHFCTGLLLALFGILWSWLILLPFVAGVSKELLDKYVKKTGFDTIDMLVTWLGAIPVIVILTLKYLLIC
nr:MAG TPA: hypothetical protein [Caudoviricetes sp.]